MIGFGIYQSCRNRGSVVFGLRWCVGGGGVARVEWCYVCVCCESGLFV